MLERLLQQPYTLPLPLASSGAHEEDIAGNRDSFPEAECLKVRPRSEDRAKEKFWDADAQSTRKVKDIIDDGLQPLQALNIIRSKYHNI